MLVNNQVITQMQSILKVEMYLHKNVSKSGCYGSYNFNVKKMFAKNEGKGANILDPQGYTPHFCQGRGRRVHFSTPPPPTMISVHTLGWHELHRRSRK